MTKDFVRKELVAVIEVVVANYVFAAGREDRDAVIDDAITRLNSMRPDHADNGPVIEIPSPPGAVHGTAARAIGLSALLVREDSRTEPALATEINKAREEVKRRWSDGE